MSLAGALAPGERMPAEERAREPRSLAIVAYFDGYTRASYPDARRHDYPRRLDHEEAAHWRQGWREGHTETRCHAAHGFTPCPTPGQTHAPDGGTT